MEDKKVEQLRDDELIKELAYANKMKKFYYARTEEILKEIERRS